MLAAIAPVPTYGFVLSLDEAKAGNAAALARVAPEPQLGPMIAAGFADQLAQASALHDNHLSLDHSVYGKVKNNPGEVLALIKTMKDLEAKGNEVDWTRSNTLYMPGNVGPDQKNNTTKSVAFKTLMATNLGERIQRKYFCRYRLATNTAWFQEFLVKYHGENT
jgi:hypothetical protein